MACYQIKDYDSAVVEVNKAIAIVAGRDSHYLAGLYLKAGVCAFGLICTDALLLWEFIACIPLACGSRSCTST